MKVMKGVLIYWFCFFIYISIYLLIYLSTYLCFYFEKETTDFSLEFLTPSCNGDDPATGVL